MSLFQAKKIEVIKPMRNEGRLIIFTLLELLISNVSVGIRYISYYSLLHRV